MDLLWILAILVFIGWLLGAFAFHAGGLIHILWVVILILVIIRLVKGKR